MLVTREMDYAVRIMRALFSGEKLTSEQIAGRENMQVPITYKIMKQLTLAGVVNSSRGKNGGYTLGSNAEKLTLYDVFHALDYRSGNDGKTCDCTMVTECLRQGYECPNNTDCECGVHAEFVRIQNKLDEELKRNTLKKLFATKD